jgi:hypothetical protein
VHPGSRCDRRAVGGVAGLLAATDTRYEKWIAAGNEPLQVQAASNGIAFLPDYKNWKSISSTDRVDNQTLRVILV